MAQWRIRVITLYAGVLLLSACQTGPDPDPSPSVQDGINAAPAHADAGSPTTTTTIQNDGLIGCWVGCEEAELVARLGPPTQRIASSSGGEFHRYRDLGIDLKVVDGHVSALFFYFLSADHKPFAGQTDKGIGAQSSVDDVLKAYGKPRYEGRSRVSEFGAIPGALERSLEYDRISFTFYDDRLGDVRVVRPR